MLDVASKNAIKDIGMVPLQMGIASTSKVIIDLINGNRVWIEKTNYVER
jgi:hypothetical protein